MDALNRITSDWAGNAELLARAALVAALAVGAALLLYQALFLLLRRLARNSDVDSDAMLLRSIAGPLRASMVAIALAIAASTAEALNGIWAVVGGFVVPALVGWFVIAIVRAFAQIVQIRSDISIADNLTARRRRTRVGILSRLVTFIVIMVTVAMMLLSIPGVRTVGVTLIASAGLAGLAVGAAAQPALRSLIAGIQMALTEPIRIEDVVIIEGEWGWIEDIRTTYVVVRVWDQRRLVVPVSKFLDESFQNWTRKSAELLGTIFYHVDPATDVAPLRAEVRRLAEANARWDGRVAILQVTDTTADSMELRALVSAKDAPTLFDLRCEVREGLMDYIRREMPEAIVRRRLVGVDADSLGAPEISR